MWSFVTIFAFCCVISTDAVTISVNGTESKVKIVDCHQGNTNKYVGITVLEGELLTINIQPSGSNNDSYVMNCTSMEDPKLLLSSSGGPNDSLTVSNDTGGMWRCTTPSDQCFIKVHVRLKDSPQTVLQHNMVLPVQRNTDWATEYDHIGKSFYTDIEDISMSCIVENNMPVTKNISLKYICPGLNNGMIDDLLHFQPPERSPIDNCSLLCTYEYENDVSVTKVEFVHQPLENDGHLKVNGFNSHPQDGQKQGAYKTLLFNPTYIFFANEKVNISCHTQTPGMVVNLKCSSTTENDIVYNVKLSEPPSSYRCSICNNTKNEVKRFIVTLIRLEPSSIDPIKPTVLVTSSPADPDNKRVPEEGNEGRLIAIIIFGVIVAALVVIAIVLFLVRLWKKCRPTARDEGIGDQNNSDYAVPYDHMRNFATRNTSAQPPRVPNNYTTSPKNSTAHINGQSTSERISQTGDQQNSGYADHKPNCNPAEIYSEAQPKNLRRRNNGTTPPKEAIPESQNTNERIPQTVDRRNSLYTNLTDHDDLYAKTVPKSDRPRDNNTMAPKADPTELETPEYLNENEIQSELDEVLYENKDEVISAENSHVNEGDVNEEVYANLS